MARKAAKWRKRLRIAMKWKDTSGTRQDGTYTVGARDALQSILPPKMDPKRVNLLFKAIVGSEG